MAALSLKPTTAAGAAVPAAAAAPAADLLLVQETAYKRCQQIKERFLVHFCKHAHPEYGVLLTNEESVLHDIYSRCNRLARLHFNDRSPRFHQSFHQFPRGISPDLHTYQVDMTPHPLCALKPLVNELLASVKAEEDACAEQFVDHYESGRQNDYLALAAQNRENQRIQLMLQIINKPAELDASLAGWRLLFAEREAQYGASENAAAAKLIAAQSTRIAELEAKLKAAEARAVSAPLVTKTGKT